MKRMLIRSSAFVRAAKRLLKKYPQLAKDLRVALDVMSEDVFDPKLKTHKLKGDLEGSWSCSAGYDLRIILSGTKVSNSDFRDWRSRNGRGSDFLVFSDIKQTTLKPPDTFVVR